MLSSSVFARALDVNTDMLHGGVKHIVFCMGKQLSLPIVIYSWQNMATAPQIPFPLKFDLWSLIQLMFACGQLAM